MGTSVGRVVRSGLGYGRALAGFFLRSGKALGGPVAIAIEPTNVCNLHCPLCTTGAGMLDRPRGSMSLEAFRTLIDSLPRTITDLYLWGQGEPFLAPGFLDMVRFASARGFRTYTSTNGHYLDDTEGIIKSGLSSLVISLDGVDRATYDSYRQGGNFDLVVDGIRKVSGAKRKNGIGPVIELQYLVTRENAVNMKRFRSFARSIGAERVVFKTLQAASLQGGMAYLPENWELTRYHEVAHGDIAPERVWPLKNRCMRVYYNFQIDWQGNIVPCCFDKDSTHIMGNVFDTPVLKIWNSEPYRSFRTTLNLQGRVIPMCRDCSEGLKRMSVHG